MKGVYPTKAGYGGVVMGVGGIDATQNDIITMQGDVAREAQLVDAAVQRCMKVDDSTRAAWGLTYAKAMAYATMDTPSIAGIFSFPKIYGDGEALIDEMDQWVTKFNAAPYQCGVPLIHGRSGTEKAADAVEGVIKGVSALAITGVIVYGAYELVKWVDVLRPSKR